RSKRPFEAVEAARRFLRSTTSTGDTRTILDVLNRHGLRREAAALLDELAKTKKIDNADARWVRDLAALRLATLEKNDAAIRRLHALLLRESGRDRIKHWIALARFYLSADRNQLALEAAARVMKMGAPRDLSSIYELGVQALVRLRRHDDLDRWNERFVKRSEDRLNAYQLVSRVLAMHHLSKDALRYGHLALQMRRNNAQVLPTLINAALTLPPDDGRRELDRLSRLSSNRFQFWDDVLNRSRRRHRFAYLIDASRRKLEKQPGYTLQLLTSGATALFRGDRAAAKKQFTEYIRRSSGKVRAHLEVGIYYTWSFYLDDAERHLRQCLKLQPSAIEGWIGLFRVALLRGSSDDAIAIAKRAVAEISTPSAILEHLVSVVLQQYPAPDTRVLTQLAAFGRRAPESLPNLVLSALLLARGGDKAQTLAALRRVAHGDTSQGLWSRAIAISLLRNKRIEAGLAALDLYLSGGRTRYERSKRLRVSVGTILLALRLNAETLSNAERGKLRVRGLALIESLRGADRKRETHVVTTAAIYEHGGLPSKAIWLFRGALRQRPSASVYYNNLAYLFARRGHDLEEALRLVRKAARLDPKKRMYYDDTEGWVLFKMGRVRDAKARILGSMRIIDETMQLSDMVEYYYHLALIELKLGNRKAAIWRLRQAANVDGSGIYGLRSRGILLRLLGLRGTRDKP
ncbi:MAG: hypothetical protein KC609_17180, partial [Myxococcales bacterium]|nr:hypothetical protein [Myxococcales bacterium]